MRTLTFALLFFIIGLSSYGQVSTDPITIKKVFGGYLYYQNDKKLTMSRLVKAMRPNEQAFKEIKAAQSTYVLASIIGGAGGFMIGWPLGTAIAGGEPNWVLAGIGAGLFVVSIPINQKFNRQAKAAVDTYNGGLKTSSIFDKAELKFAFNGNRLGITVTF